ncbi:hypothetical protein [Streptomyces sp. NPDC001137]|uniref:hypothetical protein n=1 Tax=Streptomyces sp. NPDC001137 TaxID=3154378 RepID=UPI00331E5346
MTGGDDPFAVGFEYLADRGPLLGEDSFGHSGATGSLAFADPASGVAHAENGRLAHAVLRAASAS